MESDSYGVGIKSEEIEILDVVTEEDFCEDETPLLLLQEYISEREDGSSERKNDELRKIKGDTCVSKQNSFYKVNEYRRVSSDEYLSTFSGKNFDCQGNAYSKELNVNSSNSNLYKTPNICQDSSTNECDSLQHIPLTTHLENPAGSNDPQEKCKEIGGKWMYKRNTVSKYTRNGQIPNIKPVDTSKNECKKKLNSAPLIKNCFGDSLISMGSSLKMRNENKKPNSNSVPYKCPYCDFQTGLHNLLLNHKRKHKILQPWACSKCKFSSRTKYSLERHLKLIHEKPQNIPCKYCDFKCSSQKQLKNHMIVHTHNNYFKCSECDFKHTVQSKLKVHMVKHLDDIVNLMCSVCGYKGVKPEYLLKHMEKHHGFELDFDKAFSVKELAKVNSNTYSSNHLNCYSVKDYMRITEKQPVVLLKRCDENINDQNMSEVNMGIIHDQILLDNFLEVAKCGKHEETTNTDTEFLNSVKCEKDPSVCFKSTLITKNENVISSLVKVFPDDQNEDCDDKSIQPQIKVEHCLPICQTVTKPVVVNEILYNKVNCKPIIEEYCCNKCSFVSMWFDSFEKHVKLHHKECLSCNKCDFITNSKSSLTRHAKLKHSQKKDFMCEKCNYCCSTLEYLKSHMKSHIKSKCFKCERCHTRCKTAEAFKRHITTHDVEKPFACDICDFRTRYKVSLKNHMYVHTGDTKYVCKICNQKFYSNCHLKKHNMLVHKTSK